MFEFIATEDGRINRSKVVRMWRNDGYLWIDYEHGDDISTTKCTYDYDAPNVCSYVPNTDESFRVVHFDLDARTYYGEKVIAWQINHYGHAFSGEADYALPVTESMEVVSLGGSGPMPAVLLSSNGRAHLGPFEGWFESFDEAKKHFLGE